MFFHIAMICIRKTMLLLNNSVFREYISDLARLYYYFIKKRIECGNEKANRIFVALSV